MFQLVKERLVWWPVAWMAADDDGGTVSEQRFEMRFKMLDLPAIAKIVKQAEAIDDTSDATPLPEKMAALIAQIAVDWRKICGENKEPLVWNDANLAMVMRMPGLFFTVIRAWRACINGEGEVRAKN